MTRYFYHASRTHHAYCMARDFGMEFEKRFGKWEPEGLLHIDPASSYRLYVHPDSLHLLEPKVGDFIVDAYGDVWTKGNPPPPMREGDKIIQRNGIAFMWPEVEA